jgi:hypothetical protein
MLNQVDFIRYYKENISEFAVEYAIKNKEERQKASSKTKIIFLILLILSIILFLLFEDKTVSIACVLVLISVAIGVIEVMGLGRRKIDRVITLGDYALTRKYQIKNGDTIEGLKTAIYKGIIKPAIETFFEGVTFSLDGITEADLLEAKMVETQELDSKNRIEFYNNENKVYFSDNVLITYNKGYRDRSNYISFDDAVLGKIKLNCEIKDIINLENDLQIYLPNPNNLKRYKTRNEVFDSLFKVYTNNNYLTESILKSYIQDCIIEFRRVIGKNFRVSFHDNNMYILIDKFKIIDLDYILENNISQMALYNELIKIEYIKKFAESIIL